MTFFIKKDDKNLLLSAGIYLTNDPDFEKGDVLKVQDRESHSEDSYDVTEVVSDAPLCKPKTRVVILKPTPDPLAASKPPSLPTEQN